MGFIDSIIVDRTLYAQSSNGLSVAKRIDIMRNMKKIFGVAMLAGATFALGACNHVNPIGSVGDQKFYAVRSTDISGPNMGLIVQLHPNGETTNVAAFGSDGVLPSVVTAAGNVAAAEVSDADRTNVDIGDRQYITPQQP